MGSSQWDRALEWERRCARSIGKNVHVTDVDDEGLMYDGEGFFARQRLTWAEVDAALGWV